MKFEHTEVWGFEHAIRGMRNPLESWDKSDSRNCDWSKVKCFECDKHCLMYNGSGCTVNKFLIGDNDIELARRLIRAGSEHRKFMRQIMVSVDITAPLYWWKEFDTYKVGTVENSTSTMHKLTSTPITKDCFEMGDFDSNVYVYDVDNEQVATWEFWKQHLIPFLERACRISGL